MTAPENTEANDLRTIKMMSAVCHDLSGPVRHIHGFVEILADHLGDGVDDACGDYLQRLQSAATRMEERLAGLGRLTMALSGDLVIEPCSASQALYDALLELSSVIERSSVEILLSELPEVHVDQASLTGIFVELLQNALKFCPGRVAIEVGTVEVDGQAWMSVRDNGPGLKPTDADRATELFRRFHPNLIPGTGTGLAVVSETLRRQGGEMSIVSKKGSGTEVRFWLPPFDARSS